MSKPSRIERTNLKYFLLLSIVLLLALLAATVRAEVQENPAGKVSTGVFVDVSSIRHGAKSWGNTWDQWMDSRSIGLPE